MKLFEGFILFFCFVLACFLISFYFIEYKDFRKGVLSIKIKKYTEAQSIFSNLISLNEFDFPARLNLALSQLLQKKNKEALEEYKRVGELSKKTQERYYAYFNSGFIQGFQDIDKSLEFYQKSLKENKNSIEAKTNIELLMKESQNQNSENSEDSEEQRNSQKNETSSQKQNTNSENLSLEQIENILKEIDDHEQKLKIKLNQVPEKDRGKKW